MTIELSEYLLNAMADAIADAVVKKMQDPSYNLIKTELEPCDDVISRQAALGCCRNEWEEEVEMRLKALPSVTPQPNKWIPVSERLPDKYTYTLWCASSGYVRSDYFNGEFWEDAKKYCYEITAWMPLPLPYKQEVEE